MWFAKRILDNRTGLLQGIAAGALCLFMNWAQAVIPLWTFKPLTPTTLIVPANGIALINYRVTNQSVKPHTLRMNAVQGIRQITGGTNVCGSEFVLPAQGSSCILSLQVNGSQLTNPISTGPIVCQGGNNNQCYQPSQNQLLHITQAPPVMSTSIAFTPLTSTTLSVPANSTAIVQYQVSNQISQPQTLVMKPIQGIQQITTGPGVCGSVFVLPVKNISCILTLQINGSQLSGAIHGGPVVCRQGFANQCSQPTPANVLNITPSPGVAHATIRVTGSFPKLVIHNMSLDVTATNIAGVGHVVETGNTCTAVEPMGSCMLTYMAGSGAVSLTRLSIKGSNTNEVPLTGAFDAQARKIKPHAGTRLGNTSVVLTGVNLADTTAVTFDGLAAAKIVVVNPTSVIAETPVHPAGVVDVVISTPTVSTTLTGAYIYEALPNLADIMPASGPAVGETGVTLTGTNLASTTEVTFDGLVATQVNVINSTTITAVAPAHTAGIVDVVIATPEGSTTLAAGYTYGVNAIGASTGGGKIACLNGDAPTMIVAVSDDPASPIKWGVSRMAIGTSAQSETTGDGNTAAIVTCFSGSRCPALDPKIDRSNYAAGRCATYEVDSQGNTPCKTGNTCYNNWFLPAKDQLNCLFSNKVALGGFADDNYWSSTEFASDPSSFAVRQSFISGSLSIGDKVSIRRVRCVQNNSQ